MTTPSIQQQADFLYYLVRRCSMIDGSIADQTSLVLTRKDVEDLDALRVRIERMAPHEADIKRVVVGRK